MADSMGTWAVALDGGTTNTRARLVDAANGRVAAVARRGVGVRDSVLPGRGEDRPLWRGVREALDEVVAAAGGVRPGLIVAAGMLSSEVGLLAVPHVPAPAGLDALADGAVVRVLPAISDTPIVFVPGVRTPAAPGTDGWASADVMRGEECETLGAWLRLVERPTAAVDPPGNAAFLWPGSHTKLVEVDTAGRIVRSQTTLAGELLHATARHTLLAASLPDALPDDPDPTAVEAGARLAGRDGLGRAAFLVRVAALTGAMEAEARAAFWVGAVVGDDVAHLSRHAILRGDPPPTVRVGGRRPLRGLYVDLLGRRHGAPVVSIGDDDAEEASALGALAVARRLLERRGGGPPSDSDRDTGTTG